jgi:outer membrane lipoprotein carrier protein
MRLFLSVLLLSSYLFSEIKLADNFSSNFTQIVTNSKNKKIKYSGRVRMSQAKYLKWQYREPSKKEVCSDGKTLLVVDHDLEQVSAYRMNHSLDIAKILRSATHYKDTIYVTVYEETRYTIALDEKQRVQSIAYFDNLDNKVQIVFENMTYSDVKFNQEIMQCNYPNDYDVIRG